MENEQNKFSEWDELLNDLADQDDINVIEQNITNEETIKPEKRKEIKMENEKISFRFGMGAVGLCLLNLAGIPFVHLIGIVYGVIGLTFSGKAKYTDTYEVGIALNIIGIALGVIFALYGMYMHS